jgi:hypothetical protein
MPKISKFTVSTVFGCFPLSRQASADQERTLLPFPTLAVLAREIAPCDDGHR